MKKYSLYFALLALSAFLCFLASCGSGEVVDITNKDSSEFIGLMETAEDYLYGAGSGDDKGLIGRCILGTADPSDCPDLSVVIEESSSSEYVEYSSEGGGGDDQSSSSEYQGGGGESSSSEYQGGGGESSSSTPIQQSSSSGGGGGGGTDISCPTGKPTVEGFSCQWKPKSDPVAGDKITWESGKFTTPEGAECTEEVKIQTVCGFDTRYYTFPMDEEISVVSGENIGTSSLKWPASTSGGAPVKGCDADIQASVICKVGAEVVACKAMPCALTVKSPPNPAAKVNTAVKFDNAHPSSSSSIFYIGETPTVSGDVEVTNMAESRCGSVAYRVVKATGGDPIDGAVTEAMNIRAEAYCTGTGTALTGTGTNATATVVPNPGLEGTCEWDTKNDTWGGGVSAKVKNAATIKITSQYGRTCNGPFFAVGGVQKTNVSAGLTVDGWDGTDTQTMTGITISANCGDTDFNAISCPNIKVKDPDAMCEYTSSICGNITLANVKTPTGDVDAGNLYNNSYADNFCVYVTGATGILGFQSAESVKVNGQTVASKCAGNQDNSFASCVEGIDKIDGGYYIYRKASEWMMLKGATGGSLSANCPL